MDFGSHFIGRIELHCGAPDDSELLDVYDAVDNFEAEENNVEKGNFLNAKTFAISDKRTKNYPQPHVRTKTFLQECYIYKSKS